MTQIYADNFLSPARHLRRILILRGGALGDFILTLPAISAIRQLSPQGYIELVGRPEIAELACVSGLVDKVTSIDSAWLAPYFAVDGNLSAAEISWLSSFDAVISYVHDEDHVVRTNLLRNGARFVLGISPIVEAGHAIDSFLEPLRALGVKCEAVAASQLTLPAELRAQGRRLLDEMGFDDRVVAVHPGSGSIRKNWPLKKFIELATRLERTNSFRILFTVGEADEGIVRGLEENGGQFLLLQKRSLLETAIGLSECSRYIGNDSGITHLAAALGLPTVALFGPTDPAMWAPRGDNVKVVAAAGGPGNAMERIRLQSVLDAAGSFWPPR